jgi:periplasmic copper chaperone A
VIKVFTAGLAAALLSLPVTAQQPKLEFENVWIRAMPPFQPNSAGYLTITNPGDVAVAIVGASSNVSDKVELHTTRKVDGLMRMEPLDVLVVAPGERVALAPGGTHLMLLGLAFRLVPGDDVRLCFRLATKEELCADAEVRKTPGGYDPDAESESDSESESELHQHH